VFSPYNDEEDSENEREEMIKCSSGQGRRLQY
jgi:hypothetical protein